MFRPVIPTPFRPSFPRKRESRRRGMFVAGETAPSGADTLTLTLSHQGRGDLSVGFALGFRSAE